MNRGVKVVDSNHIETERNLLVNEPTDSRGGPQTYRDLQNQLDNEISVIKDKRITISNSSSPININGSPGRRIVSPVLKKKESANMLNGATAHDVSDSKLEVSAERGNERQNSMTASQRLKMTTSPDIDWNKYLTSTRKSVQMTRSSVVSNEDWLEFLRQKNQRLIPQFEGTYSCCRDLIQTVSPDELFNLSQADPQNETSPKDLEINHVYFVDGSNRIVAKSLKNNFFSIVFDVDADLKKRK